MVESAIIRLVVAPGSAGKFAARLESTGEVIVAGTRQPLVDGARELLARGFDPGTPLTMRMEGKTYDSFQPPAGRPVGQVDLHRGREYSPAVCSLDAPSRCWGGAKVGFRALGGSRGPGDGESLPRRTAVRLAATAHYSPGSGGMTMAAFQDAANEYAAAADRRQETAGQSPRPLRP
jgi:hypothetical protein